MMGASFTNDIILIEECYTFHFSDCTITNLRELSENESFTAACGVFGNPGISYTDTSDMIEITAGDKKTVANIYSHRIDLIYVYDEPQIEEKGIFGRVKEMRVRSFFQAFRKRLLSENVLTFGPPKGPISRESDMPGRQDGRHTPGCHVYHIDFKP